MRVRPPGRRATAAGTAALVVAGLAVWMVPASAVTFAATGVDPAPGARLRAVSTVRVTFTEPVSPTSRLTVTDASGAVACASTGSLTMPSNVLSCTPTNTTGKYADGTYTVQADATPTATSTPPATAPTASKNSTFTVDSVLAPAPTVSVPAVGPANQTAVPVSGTTEPLATLVITVRDTASRTVTADTAADGTGAYRRTLDLSSLADGALGVQVVATDDLGNTATGTATTRKSTSSPTVVSTNPADGSSVQNASTVSATYDVPVTDGAITLRRSGTVYDGTSSTSGNTVTFTPTGGPLVEGSYTAFVSATANGLTDGRTFTFVVDRTAPAAPTLVVPPRTGNALQVSGTGEAGAVVTVTATDALTASRSATATVGTDGRYSAVLDVSTLRDGTLNVRSTQRDAAGNTSPAATGSTTKDGTAPTAPTVTVDPQQIGAARQSSVVVTGTAEALSRVTLVVRDGTGATAATATATTSATTGPTSASGTYRFDDVDVSPLRDGTLTFTVTSVDADGNSSSSTPTTATKDTVPPAVAATRFDRALYNATSSSTIHVLATHDGGSSSRTTVVVTDSAGNRATGTVSTMSPDVDVVVNGSALVDGVLTASVTTTDAAGNVSTPGTATSAKDGTAPANATQEQSDVNAANAATYTVRGVVQKTVAPVVVEPGATVTVTIDDVNDPTSTAVSGTTVARSDGRYAVTVDVRPLRDGTLTISVTVTDAAGNAMTYRQTRAKDVVAPGQPTVALNPGTLRAASDGTVRVTASGRLATADVATSATGTVTVVVTDRDGATRSASAVPDPTTGAYSVSIDVTGLSDGTLTGVARVVDSVGNTSPPSDPASALKDPVQLASSRTTPAAGETRPDVQEVTVVYNEAINGATLTVTNTTLGFTVGGTTTIDGSTATKRFESPLPDGRYTVREQARDRYNDTTDTTYSFTVGPLPASPSPSPSATATATATATASASPSPSQSATATASPSPSATPTASASPTVSPSPSSSPTSESPSPSPSPSPSSTSPSPSPSASNTSPSPSPSPTSASPSPSPSPSSASPSPSSTSPSSTSPSPSPSPSPSSSSPSPSPSPSSASPSAASPSPSTSPSPSPSATSPSPSVSPTAVAPLKPTVTITVAPATIRPGVVSTLSGRATPGSSLEVMAYSRPSTAYGVVRTLVVPADGTYSFGLTPGRNTRLFVQVTNGGGTTISETRTINVQTNVSSAVARTTKKLTYRFTGSVLPRRAGQLITISQRVGGKDVTLVKTRTLSNGSYRVDRTFQKAATLQYRATATGDPQNVAGSTTVRTLKVR